MGQKQKRVRQKEQRDYRQKNKRGDIIEKWDPTDSPEIPDKGETSEMPGLPSGGGGGGGGHHRASGPVPEVPVHNDSPGVIG